MLCFCIGITCHKEPEYKRRIKPQLDWRGTKAITSEANELGVFCLFLAGGEPFLFPGLLELCAELKNRCFIIFTNGTVFKEDHFKRLKPLSNTAIIVSIEGEKEATHLRRGKDVYQKASSTLKRLSEIGIPNGISATITRFKYLYWMKPEYIDSLIAQGIQAAVFIEYIPVMSPFKTNPNKNADLKNGVNEWLKKRLRAYAYRQTELNFGHKYLDTGRKNLST